jgi:hypothetical protein
MVKKEEVFSFHCKVDGKVNGFLEVNNNEIVELLDFGDGKEPTCCFLCSKADFEEAMSIKGVVVLNFRTIHYIRSSLPLVIIFFLVCASRYGLLRML